MSSPVRSLSSTPKPNGYTNGHCPRGFITDDNSSALLGLQGNNTNKGWIIQKFGGTSVGKFPKKIARDIVKANIYEHQVAIVCSARSTDTKAEGTTNR